VKGCTAAGLDGGRLTESQLVTTMMFTVLGTAYFFQPFFPAAFAGHDSWTSIPAAVPYALAPVLLAGYLGGVFPGFNLFDWMEIIVGRRGGKLLQILYVLWFFQLLSVVLNEFFYFTNIGFMPRTPALVLTSLLVFLAGAAVYGGVEMLGRLATVFLPVSLVVAIGLIILATGLYDPANLRPVLERGASHVLAGAMTPGVGAGETVIGAMFFPFLKKPAQGGRALARAVFYVAALAFLVNLAVDLAFGDEAARLYLPVFALAREINLMNFVQHLEGFALVLWVASIFVKVAVWYYAAVLGMAQIANLKSYRPLVFPAGLLILAVTAGDMPDLDIMVHFVSSVVPFYFGVFEVVIPLALAVAVLAGRERRQGRRPTPAGAA